MQLVLPDKRYINSYLDAKKEYEEYNVTTYRFFDASKEDVFEKLEILRTGKNLKPGYVRETHLWLVEGDKFIGEVSIRHSLTEALMRHSGNIGYGIRCSMWNKGFGTKILAMALKYTKEEIGLNKVLITCNDDNYGSIHVIEHNGGILQDKISNIINGKDIITRRYWIEI